jgi:hypothetical protein
MPALFTPVWIIFSDYFSLFLVRVCLSKAAAHPIFSLVLGSMAGTIIVVSVYILITIFGAIGFFNRIEPWHNLEIFYLTSKFFAAQLLPAIFRHITLFLLSIGPGFAVHLWLLLFALAVLVVQTLYSISRVFRFAQWFLKQGNRNPLRAIGMVAAIFVFLITAIWKWLHG